MKKRFSRIVLIVFILLLIAGALVENLILHPFRGNTFDLLRTDRAGICEIRINHYGETVKITEPNAINTVTALFDCQLERRGTDFFTHSNGVDWYVEFVSEEGTGKGFLFYPSNGTPASGESKVKMGHYYYACSVIIDDSIIHDYWKKGIEQS